MPPKIYHISFEWTNAKRERERERDRNNKCCFLSNVIQLSVRDKFRSASFFDFYNFYNFKLHSFTDVLQLRQKSSFFRLKNLNYFFAVTFESLRREMREEEKWRNGDFPEWRRRFENLPKYVFFKYLFYFFSQRKFAKNILELLHLSKESRDVISMRAFP